MNLDIVIVPTIKNREYETAIAMIKEIRRSTLVAEQYRTESEIDENAIDKRDSKRIFVLRRGK